MNIKTRPKLNKLEFDLQFVPFDEDSNREY